MNPNLKKAVAETETASKVASLMPSRSDVEAMGGVIKENGDGTWTANLSGRGAKELAEAQRPWARAADDVSRTRSAKQPVEWLKRSDGTLVPAHPSKAKLIAARQGLRAYESRRPSRKYINGVWYRRVGKDWVSENHA